MHKFQIQGLGAPPYTFTGVYELVGGHCDYCNQGIRYAYWFLSDDDHVFKVGGDCFWKAHEGEDTRQGTPGRELVKTVKKARQVFMKRMRDERLVRETKDIRQRMSSDASYLADKPHPRPFPAALGKTLRDHVVSVFDAGTVAERIKVCKIVGSLA